MSAFWCLSVFMLSEVFWCLSVFMLSEVFRRPSLLKSFRVHAFIDLSVFNAF